MENEKKFLYSVIVESDRPVAEKEVAYDTNMEQNVVPCVGAGAES